MDALASMAVVQSVQTPKRLTQDMNLGWNLPCLQNLLVLHFVLNERSCSDLMYKMWKESPCNIAKWLIMCFNHSTNVLLLTSGNVQPIPDVVFKSLPGLNIVHFSLLSKMDMSWINRCVHYCYIWNLTESVINEDINTDGCNAYRVGRPQKFHIWIVLAESICKQLEFLAVNVKVTKSVCRIFYSRPPSAIKDVLQTLMHQTKL